MANVSQGPLTGPAIQPQRPLQPSQVAGPPVQPPVQPTQRRQPAPGT